MFIVTEYAALNGAQYYPDFCELVSRHVLFFVTEIKLDHTDVISVDGYIFESKPRQAKYIRKSGGIGVFIKQSLQHVFEIVETDCDYIFWLKLSK